MVERAALEMRCTGNRTVGSNPTLSANEGFRQAGAFVHSGEGLRAGLTLAHLASGPLAVDEQGAQRAQHAR